MSAMQRNKGKAGEREAGAPVREMTGWNVRRRVRQHAEDYDLQGVPSWAVEGKRQRTATLGEVASWWVQTVIRAGALLRHLPMAALAGLPVQSAHLLRLWHEVSDRYR